MAQLNLVPNPSVMVVQLSLFLTALVIIKKLFLKPYLSIREKRQNSTVGSQESAREMVDKSEQLSKTISERLGESTRNAQKTIEDAKNSAVEKRTAIVEKAQSEANSVIENMRGDIKKQLSEERQKVSQVVKDLSDKVYEQTLV